MRTVETRSAISRLPSVALVLIAAAGIALGLLAASVIFPDGPSDPRDRVADATVLFGQERPLPAFALEAHDGSSFNRESLIGHWTLLFFGYTHCPDVCPITLGKLAAVLEAIEDRTVREHLKIVFVSVDPGRDTAARLAQYVPFFNPDFVGVTGKTGEIDKLTRALGAVYRLGKPDADGSYSVDHSSRLMLIGPDARFTALLDDSGEIPVMAGDLDVIIKAYSES